MPTLCMGCDSVYVCLLCVRVVTVCMYAYLCMCCDSVYVCLLCVCVVTVCMYAYSVYVL